MECSFFLFPFAMPLAGPRPHPEHAMRDIACKNKRRSAQKDTVEQLSLRGLLAPAIDFLCKVVSHDLFTSPTYSLFPVVVVNFDILVSVAGGPISVAYCARF